MTIYIHHFRNEKDELVKQCEDQEGTLCKNNNTGVRGKGEVK